MKYIKIKNIVPEGGGNIDYKGLNIELFETGSQVYMPDLSYCVVKTTEENIPNNSDIEILVENSYKEIAQYISSLEPKTQEQLEIETLKLMVADLALNSGGIL